MKRILVVANRTLCEQHLLDELRRRRAEAPVAFHVVVPATHAGGAWDDGGSEAAARARLNDLLDTLAVAGIVATGEIGDGRPIYAVQDAVRAQRYDEVIISTLPVAVSRWLGQNVVRRVRARTGLPVTHVVAEKSLVS